MQERRVQGTISLAPLSEADWRGIQLEKLRYRLRYMLRAQ